MKCRELDFHEGRGYVKYDPAVHSEEEIAHAVGQYFATVYVDLIAGSDGEMNMEHCESMSHPAFIDLIGDTLCDFKLPSEKIDEVQAWCKAGARRPTWDELRRRNVKSFKELEEKFPFTFKGYTP